MITLDRRAATQQRIAEHYQRITGARRRDSDGVVITPVEVVDFQLRAVADLLAARDTDLTDARVRITDPFGGTGIYLARLIQTCGLDRLGKIDLARRCRMIEIDPLACEIARANLIAVMLEETGQCAVTPAIECADTFAEVA